MPHPTFFDQLWNKGVDIASQVVSTSLSAVIVASLATLTWRFKRKRDLNLEEQKVRLKAKLDILLPRERQLQKLKQKSRELESERDQIAARIENCEYPAISYASGWLDEWSKQLRRSNSGAFKAVREALNKGFLLPAEFEHLAAVVRQINCALTLPDDWAE